MHDGNELESEILFQKLGETWYIFSEIDDDVVYSALPPRLDPRSTKLELYHVIEDHLKKVARVERGLDAPM